MTLTFASERMTGRPREDFAFPLGEGWLLRRAGPERLIAVNATGKLVWDLRDAGLDEGRIAEMLASHFGLSRERTMADVASMISGLERREPSHAPASATPTLSSPVDCGVFRFGAHLLRVRSGLRDLGTDYFSRFSRRRVSDAAPAEALELSGERSGLRLIYRRETLATVGALSGLVARITDLLLRLEHPDADFLAYFHAASVGRGRQAVLLPGDSGVGKSTFVGYLSCRGFTYLGDDIVALAASDWSLRPLPTSLSLKSGSWPVLADLLPQLESAKVMSCQGRPLRYVEPADICERAGAPTIILFPAYARGRETQLSRLTPFEAVARLLDAKMDIDPPATEAKVAELSRFLEATPAYRLGYSDLESACHAVERLLDRHG